MIEIKRIFILRRANDLYALLCLILFCACSEGEEDSIGNKDIGSTKLQDTTQLIVEYFDTSNSQIYYENFDWLSFKGLEELKGEKSYPNFGYYAVDNDTVFLVAAHSKFYSDTLKFVNDNYGLFSETIVQPRPGTELIRKIIIRISDGRLYYFKLNSLQNGDAWHVGVLTVHEENVYHSFMFKDMVESDLNIKDILEVKSLSKYVEDNKFPLTFFESGEYKLSEDSIIWTEKTYKLSGNFLNSDRLDSMDYENQTTKYDSEVSSYNRLLWNNHIRDGLNRYQ